ncbi:hypothetical protein IAU60_005437 [Kwoniella sp. DSM 27419]
MGKATLSDYTIRIASTTQELQYLRASFVTWGRGRTLESFRESFHQCMDNGDWVKDGGVRNWVLVRRNDPDGDIYSGTRVYRRKALMRMSGSDHVREVSAYNITAVVTPKEHLLWGPAPPALSPEDQKMMPRAIASVLWSAVGPTFYEKVTIGTDLPGWIAREEDSLQISWKLMPPKHSVEPRWEWLYTGDLPTIGDELSSAVRGQLEADHAHGSSPIWTIDPASPGVLSYIPSRVLRPRSSDWNEVYAAEPCGVRLAAAS